MEGLRWILLIIGILIIAGIYFADRLKRRALREGADRFSTEDDTAGLNISPRATDDGGDYSDAIADLNHFLNQNRDSAASADVVDIDADIAMAWEAGEAEAAAGDASVESGEAGDEAAGAALPERLVIFYLKAPEGHAFAGPALFDSLAAAGLVLGSMGIYHDTDSHGETVFSVANLFEPGTLETDDPDNFSTRGVALFMQLPGPRDEQDAFERMLGKAEILAERLGGELHDEHHQPLDRETVTRIRGILR
ncbi:MAG: cell division protein ZipA [Gammaproteobacteria bacterium]|nr:cell division protein ZipA [Gammaproteobacteria bacterium]